MIYFYRYFEGRDSRDCLTALYCYHNCLPGNSWQCADPRLPRLGSGLDIGISIHYYHLGNYVEELTCKGEEGKRKKERGGVTYDAGTLPMTMSMLQPQIAGRLQQI